MKDLLTKAALVLVILFALWLALGVGYALVFYTITGILYS